MKSTFRPPQTGRGRTRALLLTGSTMMAMALVGVIPAVSGASSHREAPLIAAEPPLDNTDLYAFVSPDDAGTVTMIANWSPFSEPNGGPNFYPFATEARHDINIDNDGDAVADIIYRWEFDTQDQRGRSTFLYNNGAVTSLNDENLLFRQTFTLTRLTEKSNGRYRSQQVSSGPVAPSFTGPASMPDYASLRTAALTDVDGGGTTYAGQADDPFFLDLRIFDLLYGGDLSETGVDTLAGYNVNTIALQVPVDEVALGGAPDRNPAIGVWTTTSVPRTTVRTEGSQTDRGRFVQVSRLGNPLVNEVVVPTGLKDAFNALTPDQDASAAGSAVYNRVLDPEVPKLIEAIYGIPAPATPRYDLAEIFLSGIVAGEGSPINADLNSQLINADVSYENFQPSEMLRLNVTIPPTAEPNRLGVLADDLQGFPNGRRLADDVVDIEIQALEGAAVSGIVDALAAGDGVNANDSAFGDTFPYVALPNMEAVNQSGAVGVPVGGGNGGSGLFPGGLPATSLVTGALALALMAAGFTSLARGRRESEGVLA